MQQWLVFKDKETGRELCAYTIRGTFKGERQETINLLAQLLAPEEGIDPARITTAVEMRP